MDVFIHIKTVIGIILSLSIAHLLKGSVKLVQHPGRDKPYRLHLLWVFYIFILLIHFWWWENNLKTIHQWTFPEYFFIICYIMIFYVLCALLFPDDLKDYTGFEDYFYSRKKWFFSVLALCFAADVIDTSIKGAEYYLNSSWEYYARNISHFVLCLVAIKVNNKKFHNTLVIFFIVYELLYILRLFRTEG
jgi:hypothetical protein